MSLVKNWPFPTRNLYTVNRWFSLVTGVVVALCSGTQYMFGTLAPKIKDRLGYEQYQINMIATFCNLGHYAGLLPGIFHDMFGARPTCILSGMLVFIGYFCAFASISGWFPSNYLLVGLFFALMGNGSSGAQTTAVSTNIKNYSSNHRGVIVGLNSAAVGICSAVFGLLFRYAFNEKIDIFILFLAACCGGTILFLGAIFQNVVPAKEPMMTDDAPINASTPENSISHDTVAHESTPIVNANNTISYCDDTSEDLFSGTDCTTHGAALCYHETPEGEMNAFQMLGNIDFWLLCFVFFAGSGTGLTIVNNLGSIVMAYGGADTDLSTMILVYSIGNTAGRLLFGLLSDRLSNYVQRSTFAVMGTLGLGICSYLFVFLNFNHFIPLIIATGFVYGCLLVTVPAFISERFGPKYYAVNHAVCNIAPVCGSYLMATILTSTIYQRNIKGGGKNCFGKKCFALTFLINSALCVCGFLVGLILMYRNRQRTKL